MSSDRDRLSLTNRGDALARRRGANVKFRLTRRVRPLFEADIDSACGRTWLRRAGWDEDLELELEGKCPLPVQLWAITQAPAGSEVRAGHRRLVCIADADSDRARLLVKASSVGAVSADGPGSRSSKAPVELSLISPPPNLQEGRRLSWRTSTWCFSGRGAEVRQFASRMIYSGES